MNERTQAETRQDGRRTPAAALGASLLLALAAGAAASGEEGAAELVTDRPDQTESAEVVPPGRVQLELGWLLTRGEEAGVRTESIEVPGTLVRLGLREGWELRLGWGGWTEEEEEEQRLGAGERRAEGAADLDLGFKVALWEERGRRPQAALLAAVALPTGAAEITGDRYEPAARLSLAHTLSDALSLGYNLGLARESGTTLGVYTAALGIGLAPRVGAFVEAFGELPVSGGGPRHSADGGFTFLLRPNLQLDLAGGVGLSREAPDWFVGVGLSARLPR